MNDMLDRLLRLSGIRQGGEIRLGEDPDMPTLVTEKLPAGGDGGWERLPGPGLSGSRSFSPVSTLVALECGEGTDAAELQVPCSSSQHGSSCESPVPDLLLSDRFTADLGRGRKRTTKALVYGARYSEGSRSLTVPTSRSRSERHIQCFRRF